jgi:dihydrofolate reductase
MRISLIVAISENNIIGRDGRLPWRLSADLKRFKRLTMGHHLVMGRKTFESIGRLLPGRTTVVLTRNTDYRVEGAIVAQDFASALARISGDDEIFVIGGREVYRIALPHGSRMYVTAVHANLDGDTLFPDVQWDGWAMIEDVRFSADEKNDYDYSFRIYERIRWQHVHFRRSAND